MQAWVTQLRKGLTELCVLAILRRGEAYGYQILQQLDGIDGLASGEGTIYPVLARLTQDGCVKVRAEPSTQGPPRRYYRLTPLGRSRLNEMAGQWRLIETGLNHLLEESPA